MPFNHRIREASDGLLPRGRSAAAPGSLAEADSD